MCLSAPSSCFSGPAALRQLLFLIVTAKVFEQGTNAPCAEWDVETALMNLDALDEEADDADLLDGKQLGPKIVAGDEALAHFGLGDVMAAPAQGRQTSTITSGE